MKRLTFQNHCLPSIKYHYSIFGKFLHHLYKRKPHTFVSYDLTDNLLKEFPLMVRGWMMAQQKQVTQIQHNYYT